MVMGGRDISLRTAPGAGSEKRGWAVLLQDFARTSMAVGSQCTLLATP